MTTHTDTPDTQPVKLFTVELDGKKIGYSSETLFYVQVGKDRSAYRNRYTIKGNLAQAVFYYRAINIGNGYKKRLFMPSSSKPVLARAFSF